MTLILTGFSEKERQNKMHKFLETCQTHGAVAPAPAARRGFEIARGEAVVVCALPGAEVLIVAEEDHPDAKHGNSGRCHSFVKLVRGKNWPAQKAHGVPGNPLRCLGLESRCRVFNGRPQNYLPDSQSESAHA